DLKACISKLNRSGFVLYESGYGDIYPTIRPGCLAQNNNKPGNLESPVDKDKPWEHVPPRCGLSIFSNHDGSIYGLSIEGSYFQSNNYGISARVDNNSGKISATIWDSYITGNNIFGIAMRINHPSSQESTISITGPNISYYMGNGNNLILVHPSGPISDYWARSGFANTL
ncbi:MAG: hypothetical protein AAF591_23050, partial [Verrucomicrobiota bacterium]